MAKISPEASLALGETDAANPAAGRGAAGGLNIPEPPHGVAGKGSAKMRGQPSDTSGLNAGPNIQPPPEGIGSSIFKYVRARITEKNLQIVKEWIDENYLAKGRQLPDYKALAGEFDCSERDMLRALQKLGPPYHRKPGHP
jgi:hypothetical protein